MAVCSIAIAVGVLAFVGIVRRLLWRRRCGASSRRRFGGRETMLLRGILSRLGTTPGQEKEIRTALGEVSVAVTEAKIDLEASRQAAGRAVAEETFDELAVGEATVKLDAATGQVKRAFEAALRKIHATLDARQRAELAEMLTRGPSAWGGPDRVSL